MRPGHGLVDSRVKSTRESLMNEEGGATAFIGGVKPLTKRVHHGGVDGLSY